MKYKGVLWVKKRNKLLISALCAGSMLLSGCGGASASSLAESMQEALNEVTYVESAISLNMQGSTTGGDKEHTAGVLSEMKVHSSYNPGAVYSESISRITVDDVVTREYKELYIVPGEKEGEYLEYSHKEGEEDWNKSTLSEAEILQIPIKSALLRDYTELLTSLEKSNDIVLLDERENYMFEGLAKPEILQDIFGINIYGSFMTNVEALLDDEEQIKCVFYVDKETSLPRRLELTFKDSFAVTDMAFDTATITVDYNKYNAEDGIELPNTVSFTALDADAKFYNNYHAWNLFLPYVNGEKMTEADNSGGVSTFKSDWNTFQIRLDDGVTTLPLKLEDLKKLNYQLDSSFSQTLVEPNQYLDNVKLKKGNDIMKVTVYNDTTAAKPVSDCKIGAVDLSIADAPSNGIKLYLPGEVTLNMDKKALIAAYGEPDVTSNSFAADKLTWQGDDKENQLFEAEINASNNKVIRLHLRNIPVSGGNQAE